jgi:tellurite resistance protein
MPDKESFLKHFPVSMFSITMGLSGLTIITHKMTWFFGENDLIFQATAFGTFLVYVMILALYTLKSLKYPQAVLAEWIHPVKISFFPAASISLLLLGAVFYPISINLSFFLWATGTFFQFFLSMMVINCWINHTRYEIVHSAPVWFIPAVGNIIVPLIGLEHASAEVSWFFFTWGIVFWIILLVIVMNRIIFHNPLPEKLLPTLFIFIAPPSIGFITYMQLAGSFDSFARILYYCAGLFFLLVLGQLNRLRKISFTMSWWAYTFPLAAFCSATYLMGELTQLTFFIHGARGLYVISCVVVCVLILRTIKAMMRNEIFIPD